MSCRNLASCFSFHQYLMFVSKCLWTFWPYVTTKKGFVGDWVSYCKLIRVHVYLWQIVSKDKTLQHYHLLIHLHHIVLGNLSYIGESLCQSIAMTHFHISCDAIVFITQNELPRSHIIVEIKMWKLTWSFIFRPESNALASFFTIIGCYGTSSRELEHYTSAKANITLFKCSILIILVHCFTCVFLVWIY